MSEWVRRFGRWLRGERRQAGRPATDKVLMVNRQYAVAQKLGRRVGKTPDELLGDYRRADRILGKHR